MAFLTIGMFYAQETFTLKSNEIGGQLTLKQVFKGFGCTGENISPQLSWENAPKETKSFAIIMHDEVAPTGGSGWTHWVVFNIPTNTKELKSNAGNLTLNLLPKGSVQSITSFGIPGFGGACPPENHGFHKYTFTIYALSVEKLELDQNSNPSLVGYMINANTIEKASLVAYYKR